MTVLDLMTDISRRPARSRPILAEHLGPLIESWWRDLGSVTLTEKLNQATAQGVFEELGGTDLGDLTS
jgi:hypothetical protein